MTTIVSQENLNTLSNISWIIEELVKILSSDAHELTANQIDDRLDVIRQTIDLKNTLAKTMGAELTDSDGKRSSLFQPFPGIQLSFGALSKLSFKGVIDANVDVDSALSLGLPEPSIGDWAIHGKSGTVAVYDYDAEGGKGWKKQS